MIMFSAGSSWVHLVGRKGVRWGWGVWLVGEREAAEPKPLVVLLVMAMAKETTLWIKSILRDERDEDIMDNGGAIPEGVASIHARRSSSQHWWCTWQLLHSWSRAVRGVSVLVSRPPALSTHADASNEPYQDVYKQEKVECTGWRGWKMTNLSSMMSASYRLASSSSIPSNHCHRERTQRKVGLCGGRGGRNRRRVVMVNVYLCIGASTRAASTCLDAKQVIK